MPPVRPRKRARDLDRMKACGALDTAYADGQLDGDEHRARTAAATSARTVAELQELVADLQVPADLMLSPLPRPAPVPVQAAARPPSPLGCAVVVVFLCFVVLGIVERIFDDPPQPVPPRPPFAAGAPDAAQGAAPRVVEPAPLHTAEGLRSLVAAVRSEFGSTQVAEAAIHPDHAYVTIPAPRAPDRLQTSHYRGGFAPASDSGRRDPSAPLVDLAAVDPEAIAALLVGASARLNVTDPVDRSVIVRNGSSGPEVLISAVNAGLLQSGLLQVRPDGTIVGIYAYEAR